MQNAICLLFVLLALPPFAAPSRAGETPETLLIRRALASDIAGHRRADAELALKAYHPHFVAYQGHANSDPRAWTVLHENREAFADQLTADLSAQRYEVTRTVPFIAVRATHAIATSVDSGRVVDRQTSEAVLVVVHRFWTFLREEDDWLATAMVADLGDTLLPAAGAPANGEIAELLQREGQAWEAGSGILGFFDADFTGYEALGTFKPASYKIAFSGSEELEKWLDKRLPYVQYDLDRKVLHTAIGAAGDEALAVTHEKVAVEHVKGPAKHHQERYVFWTLSRRSGSWKITNMVFNLGLSD